MTGGGLSQSSPGRGAPAAPRTGALVVPGLQPLPRSRLPSHSSARPAERDVAKRSLVQREGPHHIHISALIWDLLTLLGRCRMVLLLEVSPRIVTPAARLAYLILLTALGRFKSYLSNRQHFVSMGDFSSSISEVVSKVPQGSIVGPLLFCVYMLPRGYIIHQHGVAFHFYADDSQIYLSAQPGAVSAVSVLSACLSDIAR